MDETLRSLLCQLTRFEGRPSRCAPEIWAQAAELAAEHGVAPIAAYQLEYRLAGGGAPETAREKLLGHYQGTLNDNVYKLVLLKRMLAEAAIEMALLDAISFADVLYPHVAFRPIPDLRLLIRERDLPGAAELFARSQFKERPERGAPGLRVFSDTRLDLSVLTRLLPEKRAAAELGLWERLVPAGALGPKVLRPSPEDAVLVQSLALADLGFDAPLILFVDLRELLRGSASGTGPYERPADPAVIRSRAQEWGIARAAHCALDLTAGYFPEVAEAARAAMPTLSAARGAVLDRLVLSPARDLSRQSTFRGAERLRRLLVGA